MLEDLFDEGVIGQQGADDHVGPLVAVHGAAEPAPAAAPHAARGRGGGGRGRGRGRARGYAHGEEGRRNISLGLTRREVKRLRSSLAGPSFQDEVAQKVFGLGGVDATDASRSRQPVFLRMSDEQFISMDVDTRHQHKHDIDRGVVSHLRAQASGVRNFLRDRAGTLVTLVLCLFDDADMWVRRPKNWQGRGRNAGKQEQKHANKLEDRGRCVHMPCMNMQDTVVNIASYGGDVVAVEPTQPTVPMPRANFATLFKRLRKWSVFLVPFVQGVASTLSRKLRNPCALSVRKSCCSRKTP